MAHAPPPPAARWFIALRPPPGTPEALAAARDALLAAVRDGRPVATDRLHLTLAFLGTGRRDAAEVERLRSALAGIEVSCFDFDIDRADTFRVGRRHVGWIGPREAPAQLLALAGAIRARLAAAGIDVDARPFVPHVTVLRGLEAPIAGRSIPVIKWPVDRFVLVRSHLDQPRYEDIASWPLRQADPLRAGSRTVTPLVATSGRSRTRHPLR